MDRRDRILIRLLIAFLIIGSIILAYVGYTLGQTVDKNEKRSSIKFQQIDKNFDLQKKQLELQQKQIDILKEAVTSVKGAKDGRDGKDGADGVNGKDGVTKIESHETQTVVQRVIPADPVQPLNGVNGRTPEFAIDGNSRKLLMRYEGDDDWRLVPVLCQALTVSCPAGL